MVLVILGTGGIWEIITDLQNSKKKNIEENRHNKIGFTHKRWNISLRIILGTREVTETVKNLLHKYGTPSKAEQMTK